MEVVGGVLYCSLGCDVGSDWYMVKQCLCVNDLVLGG